MNCVTYAKVLLLINKHQRSGILTDHKAHQLHMMFEELYRKGTPTSLIMEAIENA